MPKPAAKAEPAEEPASTDQGASGKAAPATNGQARPPSPRPRPAAPEAATPEPAGAAREVPAGGALPGPDGEAPGPEFTIKGNADSMLFHTPESPYYKRTKAEFWFRTAADAAAAGFTEWTPKKRP